MHSVSPPDRRVVVHFRRHHHARAELDPAIGVPAEHQIEGRVAAVARASHRGSRARDIPDPPTRRESGIASNRLLLPTPLWP